MKPSFSLVIALFVMTNVARAQDVYRTYQNARYGTKVLYPANLVVPQPESTNGDGRKFASRDGQIEVTSYAFQNVFARSMRGEMSRAMGSWKRDGARLTYSKNGVSWFVLSGFIGDDVFYEKTLLQNDVFHTLIWQYPRKLKPRLDAALTRSVTSFAVTRTPAQAASTPRASRKPGAKSRPRRTPRPRPTPQPDLNGY